MTGLLVTTIGLWPMGTGLTELHPNSVDKMDDIQSGSASAEEAKLFHDISRKWTPLSSQIKRVGFRFGEASDGSPAVWITVVVPEELRPSKDKINEIYRATESFRKDVLAANTSRWPYIRVETE